MLASSEELELLSLEALGKANMLPGILTGGNKAEGCRASCQLERVRHQAGELQNSEAQEYQKGPVLLKSRAKVCCIPGDCSF